MTMKPKAIPVASRKMLLAVAVALGLGYFLGNRTETGQQRQFLEAKRAPESSQPPRSSDAESSTCRLYRTNAVENGPPVHIASFDTNEGAQVNRENCQFAASAFQEGGMKQYWCQTGGNRN
jgi:hypothetical protein